jgi:hypothetical protein
MAQDELTRNNPPQILVDFVDKNKAQIERIGERLVAAKKEFASCVQMFGENEKTQSPKEFFSLINEFMMNFDMCRDQLQKRQEAKVSLFLY